MTTHDVLDRHARREQGRPLLELGGGKQFERLQQGRVTVRQAARRPQRGAERLQQGEPPAVVGRARGQQAQRRLVPACRRRRRARGDRARRVAQERYRLPRRRAGRRPRRGARARPATHRDREARPPREHGRRSASPPPHDSYTACRTSGWRNRKRRGTWVARASPLASSSSSAPSASLSGRPAAAAATSISNGSPATDAARASVRARSESWSSSWEIAAITAAGVPDAASACASPARRRGSLAGVRSARASCSM